MAACTSSPGATVTSKMPLAGSRTAPLRPNHTAERHLLASAAAAAALQTHASAAASLRDVMEEEKATPRGLGEQPAPKIDLRKGGSTLTPFP